MASETLFRSRPEKTTVDENAVSQLIRRRLNPTEDEKPKKQKPVRFTWEGFRDLAMGVLDTDIFSPIRRARIQELIEENDTPKEKDYIDFFGDIEKGYYKGAQKLGYSFGDLITSGIDLTVGQVFDTELTEKLNEAYEKNELADPETLIGELVKITTQYGLPGSAGFKIIQRAKKFLGIRRLTGLSKKASIAKGAGKISNIATKVGTLGASIGAMDFLGSDPDRDIPAFFMKPEKTEGLTGKELAAANFKNRLRFGAEGTLIGAGFSLLGKPAAIGFKYGIFKPIVKTAGIGLKAVDKVVVQPASWLASKDPYVIPNISKAIRKGTNFTTDQILSRTWLTARTGNPYLRTQLPPFDDWRLFSVADADPLKRQLKKLDNFYAMFRSFGEKTASEFTLSTRARREIKARSRTIEKYLESLEAKAYNVAKSFQKNYNTKTTSPAGQDQNLNQVLAYLKKQVPIDAVHPDMQSTTRLLDKELTQIRTKFGDLLPESELKDFILSNTNSYMRKSFSVFTNPSWSLKKGDRLFDDAVEYMTSIIIRNDDMKNAALRQWTGVRPGQAIYNYAENLVTGMLRTGKTDGKDPLAILQHISKRDLRSDQLLKTGEELPDVIKKLLGEEDNLRSAVLMTTNHAIVQSVNKRLADRLAALGYKEGWLFKEEAAAKAAGILDAQKITRLPGLGLLESRLNQMYASSQIAQAYRGTPGFLDGLIQNSAYRALLQFKVATQFGKTVLSPATQVRNVTSASLFPLASGHIGGRASVTDSFRMVLDDIFGAGKVINEEAFIANLENKIRHGVIDENIVASELKAVLQDIKKGSLTTLDGLYQKLANGKFMRGATRVYAGGDNVWKWYGHEYVKSQLKSAFKSMDDIARWTREITGKDYIRRDLFTNKIKTFDEAIDEAAAWYIRNTYPTYSKVPESIKAIRRLPFGNFVSFPAEMTRTSFNLIDIAGKEIASSSPYLRQIGYRRLMGTYAVLGGAGKAVFGLSSALTGVTKEQVEGYKRSFSAPWNRRSIMIPINKWIKGIGKAVNFSYFSPYDVVQEPTESLIKGLEEGKLRGEDISDYVFNSFWKMDGPMMTYFAPFLSEAIAIERVMDILPAGYGGRGGETKTGSSVYSRTDSVPDAFTKSFVHILQGVEPGAITTGKKIYKAAKGELTGSGQAMSLRDELLALFSGIRIINVDVPVSMQYKITDFQKNKRAVTEAEDFYNTKNIINRGGSVLAGELNDIQEEAFRVQQDFYQVIQDALEAGVTRSDVRKILNKRGISSTEIRHLFRGRFIPFQPSKKRMKDRVDKVQKEYGRGNVDRKFIWPKRQFDKVIRAWRNKSLKPPPPPIEEIEIEDTSRLELPKINVQPKQVAKLTPDNVPLNTPGVSAEVVKPQPVNVAQSGLTHTEEALLSNEEKAIKLRSKGITT